MKNEYSDYIAIIGAGISGLSTAYHLLELGLKPIVFEKNNYIGGHAETLDIVLDHNGEKLVRWIDMGVNDYNKKTYLHLGKIFKDIGYEGKPLDDTISFSTLDGNTTYTLDGRNLTAPSKQLQDEIDQFQKTAYETVTNSKYRYYSVEQYVKEKKYSDEFIYNNLYARINGMYFCNGDPGLMPIRMIMYYYIMQEGYTKGAKPDPDRRYFEGGTRTWMNLLNDYLNKIAGYQVVRLNTKVNIPTPLAENRKPVLLIDDEKYHFRKIVISTHADDAIHLFERGDFIPEEIISVLTRIQYSASTIVAHTSTNTFQPNYNSWRTYNIHIYDFKHGQTGPYTISYVVNRHQNDMANPQFHTIAQLPLFFLTVNPIEFPPESCILKTTSDELAIRRYKHQVLNFDLMDAQEKYLPRIQGKYGIFYCGGYGKGAGLHDQCWFFGKEIAQILAYHNFCEI